MNEYYNICRFLKKTYGKCNEEKMMEVTYNTMKEKINGNKNILLMYKAQSRMFDYNPYISNLIAIVALMFVYLDFIIDFTKTFAIIVIILLWIFMRIFNSVKIWGKYVEVAIEDIENNLKDK